MSVQVVANPWGSVGIELSVGPVTACFSASRTELLVLSESIGEWFDEGAKFSCSLGAVGGREPCATVTEAGLLLGQATVDGDEWPQLLRDLGVEISLFLGVAK